MSERPFNILLVEDEQGHAELVIRNLKKHSIVNQIYHVSNGEEALAFLFHLGDFLDPDSYPRPDVILLDLRLPKIDGLEVLKKIKSDESLASIPVIVLSTSRAESDLENAYRYHANSYLVKPLDYREFNDLLKDFGYYWFRWNQSPGDEYSP